MRKKLIILSIISILFTSWNCYGQVGSDYLILQDIGLYRLSQPTEVIPGMAPVGGPRVRNNAGVVGGSHYTDHIDTTYDLMYLGSSNLVSPIVTITQHVGRDSDRWLLHEIEIGCRDSNIGRLGLLHEGTYIKKINNDRVLGLGIGGNSYRWLSSNNVVVLIKYTDADFTKSEPKEVINAYLAKFPSVIPATFKLNVAHDVVWIKDEIERRLWLCDKWILIIQQGDVDLYDKLDSVISNMSVFLDYREKYFGLSSKNEKRLIQNFLSKRDDVSIRTKLQEYKDWWISNNGNSITLP